VIVGVRARCEDMGWNGHGRGSEIECVLLLVSLLLFAGLRMWMIGLDGRKADDEGGIGKRRGWILMLLELSGEVYSLRCMYCTFGTRYRELIRLYLQQSTRVHVRSAGNTGHSRVWLGLCQLAGVGTAIAATRVCGRKAGDGRPRVWRCTKYDRYCVGHSTLVREEDRACSR
jgi:hypothetical protein